jgi:hypothetical protein
LVCYVVAAPLAWPAARWVDAVNRWQGAAVLVGVGLAYMAGLAAVLHAWVLTDEEKRKVHGFLHRGLGAFSGREVTA